MNEFEYGDFIFSYYRFIDRFHLVPKDWGELFEFFQYESIDTKIKKFINTISKSEQVNYGKN